MRISKAGTSTNEAGFTLIEFAAVILVLGIVSALVYPQFSSFFASEALREDARKLSAAIRRLRVYAISEGLTVRIRFRLPGGKWRVEGRDAQGKWNPLSEAPVADGALSAGLRLFKARTESQGEKVEGEVALTFLPNGTTERASLSLMDERGEARILTIHPFLHRVEVRVAKAKTGS